MLIAVAYSLTMRYSVLVLHAISIMKKIIAATVAIFLTALSFAQEAPEGLFIGSKVPDVKGLDQNGQEVRLKDELKKGKVVLVFYRGQWCPYCNRFLSKLQDSLQLI